MAVRQHRTSRRILVPSDCASGLPV
ncbi:MAG: hypothetical protein P0107_01010 [Nitrosomonas sp.]|nr:hypothetical protein [Nitrosomonas sp.]